MYAIRSYYVLVGFGTRVLLGHSGQRVGADRQTLILFVLTQVILVFRIIASVLFTMDIPVFVGFVHLDFLLFIVLMSVWGIKYRKRNNFV